MGTLKSIALSLSLGFFFLLSPTAMAAANSDENLGESVAGGSVQLPLDQYLALVELAESTAAGETAETLATVTEQRLTLRLEGVRDRQVEARALFQVEVRGELPEGSVTVPLAFPAVLEHGSVTATGVPGGTAKSAGQAGLHRDTQGALGLLVRRAGSYRVELSGRLAVSLFEGSQGEMAAASVAFSGTASRLPLGRAQAAIAEAVLDLPVELHGVITGAVVVEDEAVGERRRLLLSLQRDQDGAVELVRATEAVEADTLARAVVVTTVTVGRGGIQRRDIVGFEVLRGGLGALRVQVPGGYPLEGVESDAGEGVTPPSVAALPDSVLTVPRERRLTPRGGMGRLTLTASPRSLTAVELPLDPVEPTGGGVETRARYLLLAAAVATEAEPLPAGAWARVDPEDVGQSLAGFLPEPTVVWRWQGSDGVGGASGAPRLRLAPLPAAAAHPARIVRRETTSLLTVDGTLVHRERFRLAGLTGLYGLNAGLEITLPGRARLWSTAVDGVSVRPLERGGSLTVPLLTADASGTADGPEVEVVSVEEQAILPGRTVMDLALAVVALPVLEHRWQLLLPEGSRYRYAGGSLRPAPPPLAARSSGSIQVLDSLTRTESVGSAGVEGVVRDANGDALPGVHVEIDGRSASTNLHGRFLLTGIPPGRHKALFQLSGMTSVERTLRLAAGRVAVVEVELEVATVEETIIVRAESPVSRSLTAKDVEDAREANAQAQYQQNIAVLNQGKVGGVRPLPVEIPREGKGLFLVGSLPTGPVTARLEVKRKR